MISDVCLAEAAYEQNWSGSGTRPVASFCEYCNDPWNSTRGGSFSRRCLAVRPARRAQLHTNILVKLNCF